MEEENNGINSYNTQNVHPQTVYLTYSNENQYGVTESPSTSYVLPVTILNNENFVFYNNPENDSSDMETNKDLKPEYIVNLDGSTSKHSTKVQPVQTLSIESTDKIEDIYNRYPLLNKLIVRKIFTRNLLNLSYAFQELDRLQKMEENKRKDIKIVLREPKKGRKPLKRIVGDETLKTYITTNKRFERMPTNLFKKVIVEENRIQDLNDDHEGSVIESFLKERCKAFVSDEVNRVIQEDPKGIKRKNVLVRHKIEKITSDDAGSIYPWRNKSLIDESLAADVDLDDENDSEEIENEQEEYDMSSNNLSVLYPWKNKFNDSCTQEYNPTQDINNSIQSNGDQNEVHTADIDMPNSTTHENTIKSEATDEPKFFRTKKLGDLEMKKRTYVTKELNQLRVDKKPIINQMKISESQGPSQKKRKATQNESIQYDEFYEDDREDAPLKIYVPSPTRYSKDFLTNQEKQACLEFFNKASSHELSLMPGCSTKKAEEIISLRPYSSLNNLYDKIKKSLQLNDSLIEGCQEVLNMQGILSNLLMKCERLKIRFDKVISSSLQNSQLELPKGDDGQSTINNGKLITSQPSCLNPKMKLTSYQMVGLNWLNLLHHEKINGILADEMGLGKTVQTIAFLAHLFEQGDKGPHLIIVPSSTLNVWSRELNIWCPELSVLIYHGSQDERKNMRLKIYESNIINFNILLTTYSISTGTMEDKAMMKRVNFHYGVFDEAHMLKNMLSNRYKNLVNFKVRRRLLLTGTPIQNNLLELISLLSFVMPDLFLPHIDLLKKLFQNNQSHKPNEDTLSEFEKTKINQTKYLLNPFCLRRLKEQVLSQLTAKTYNIEHLPFVESQCKLYSSVINEMKSLNEKSNGQTQNQISVVMNLRKISNHPLLIRNIYTDETLEVISKDLLKDPNYVNSNANDILEDLKYMNDFQIHVTCQLYSNVLGYHCLTDEIIFDSNKFQYLNNKLPELIGNGHRILMFSQFTMMLDILEAFLSITHCSYLRLDGQTPVTERQELIDKFNNDDSIKVFLLSTKAGGLGINLIGANVVIFHDIDFNPFNDKQAEDRCHRVGQTKDVQIIKLISKDSIEEGIMSIANNKLKLDDATSNSKSSEASTLLKKVKFSGVGDNCSEAVASTSFIADGTNDECHIDENNLHDIVQLIQKDFS